MIKKTHWSTNGLIFLPPPISQVRQSFVCSGCINTCGHTIYTDLWTEPEKVDCPYKKDSNAKEIPKKIVRETPLEMQKFQDDEDFKPKPKKDWRKRK